MGNESSTWIMYGASEDDPECIHSVNIGCQVLLNLASSLERGFNS